MINNFDSPFIVQSASAKQRQREKEMEDDHGDQYPKEDDGSEENNSMVEEEEKEEIIPPVVQEQKGEEHAADHQSPFFPMAQDKPDILSSQHHSFESFPSNNWGGASPLLSHNIPPESLEISYEKLDKVRSYDDLYVPPSPYVAPDPVKEGEEILELEKDPFLKLFMKLKVKKWKIPKMEARSRWPQGWC